MPIITHILLYAAYGMVSLTVGLALNQVGGEELGSSILGGIALFSACAVTHAGISASAAAGRIGQAEKKIKGDMERLRTAHREVAADMMRCRPVSSPDRNPSRVWRAASATANRPACRRGRPDRTETARSNRRQARRRDGRAP